MAAEPRMILILLCCAALLAGSVFYSVRHPETGDDVYENVQ